MKIIFEYGISGEITFVWLWDESKPNQRIYVTDTVGCSAYIEGDVVHGFLGPQENEESFDLSAVDRS